MSFSVLENEGEWKGALGDILRIPKNDFSGLCIAYFAKGFSVFAVRVLTSGKCSLSCGSSHSRIPRDHNKKYCWVFSLYQQSEKIPLQWPVSFHARQKNSGQRRSNIVPRGLYCKLLLLVPGINIGFRTVYRFIYASRACRTVNFGLDSCLKDIVWNTFLSWLIFRFPNPYYPWATTQNFEGWRPTKSTLPNSGNVTK